MRVVLATDERKTRLEKGILVVGDVQKERAARNGWGVGCLNFVSTDGGNGFGSVTRFFHGFMGWASLHEYPLPPAVDSFRKGKLISSTIKRLLSFCEKVTDDVNCLLPVMSLNPGRE